MLVFIVPLRSLHALNVVNLIRSSKDLLGSAFWGSL